jgi:hypothetical protein
MSLSSNAAGALTFALPAGLDDSKDYSVLLKIRRPAGSFGNAQRIVTLQNAAATRGFMIVTGASTVGWTGGADKVVVVLSDGTVVAGGASSNTWGDEPSQAGRGKVIAGASAADGWDVLAFSVRGVSAGDNAASSVGGTQLHQLWWNGGEVTATVPHVVGENISLGALEAGLSLMGRVNATSSYFSGEIADFALWQDHRLSASQVASLQANADPASIEPSKIIRLHSLRSSLTAEAGASALIATNGTAPTISVSSNPPGFSSGGLVPASVRHGHVVQSGGVGGLLTTTVQDDSGDAEWIDHVASVVTSPTSASPSIDLRVVNQSEVQGFIQICCRISGLLGKTPTITLTDVMDFWRLLAGTPPAGQPTPFRPFWEPVWRYQSDAFTAWRKFDSFTTTARTGTALNISLGITSPLSQDVIVFSFKPRVRYQDVEAMFTEWAASPFAQKPASAINSGTSGPHWFAVHSTLAGQNNSAPIVSVRQHCVRLTDSSGPQGVARKLRLEFICLQHAMEDEGQWHLRALVTRFLSRSDTVGARLRRNVDLIIHSINPTGRYYGSERFSADDAGAEDVNRAWDNTTSPQVNAAKAAIIADHAAAGGAMDVFVDVDHGDITLNPASNLIGLYRNTSRAAATDFVARYQAKSVTDALLYADQSPLGNQAFAIGWANAQPGNVLTLAIEHPESWPGYPDPAVWDVHADAFWEVVDDMLLAGELGIAPTSGLVPSSVAHGQSASGTGLSTSISASLLPANCNHGHAASVCALSSIVGDITTVQPAPVRTASPQPQSRLAPVSTSSRQASAG